MNQPNDDGNSDTYFQKIPKNTRQNRRSSSSPKSEATDLPVVVSSVVGEPSAPHTSTKTSPVQEAITVPKIPTRFVKLNMVLATKEHQEKEHQLDPDYKLQPHDVLCGQRGSKDATSKHSGNERFRVIIEMKADAYRSAISRLDKTQIVRQVVDVVRQSGGRFVRNENGIWYDVGNIRAREKAGHALRCAIMRSRDSNINDYSRSDASTSTSVQQDEADTPIAATLPTSSSPARAIDLPAATSSNELSETGNRNISMHQYDSMLMDFYTQGQELYLKQHLEQEKVRDEAFFQQLRHKEQVQESISRNIHLPTLSMGEQVDVFNNVYNQIRLSDQNLQRAVVNQASGWSDPLTTPPSNANRRMPFPPDFVDFLQSTYMADQGSLATDNSSMGWNNVPAHDSDLFDKVLFEIFDDDSPSSTTTEDNPLAQSSQPIQAKKSLDRSTSNVDKEGTDPDDFISKPSHQKNDMEK